MAPLRDRSLRWRGVGLLVLVTIETLVGNELALAGSPYPWSWLAVHIVVGLLLIGFAGHTARMAFRRPRTVARVSATLAALGSLGAFVSGLLFLFAGQSNGALYGMEGLAGLVFLAAVLLIVFGSVAPPPTPAATPKPA
jgi:hypothetical protein